MLACTHQTMTHKEAGLGMLDKMHPSQRPCTAAVKEQPLRHTHTHTYTHTHTHTRAHNGEPVCMCRCRALSEATRCLLRHPPSAKQQLLLLDTLGRLLRLP